MWLKEHRGTGRILEVLAVDEKPSLLSAVLHHVDELRRVVHGDVEALGSHHILEKQLASLLEHRLTFSSVISSSAGSRPGTRRSMKGSTYEGSFTSWHMLMMVAALRFIACCFFLRPRARSGTTMARAGPLTSCTNTVAARRERHEEKPPATGRKPPRG